MRNLDTLLLEIFCFMLRIRERTLRIKLLYTPMDGIHKYFTYYSYTDYLGYINQYSKSQGMQYKSKHNPIKLSA